MGWLAWGISALLLLGSALLLARRMARDAYAAFWIAIAAIVMQVGAAATVLSPFRLLTPAGALVFQCVVFVMALIVGLRGARRFEWPALPRGVTLVPVLLIAAMVLLTLIEQFILPVSNIDDRNYRASRAAYWMQHRSIAAFATHNDRQVAFPPGGSLPFFWGILFARNETAGLLAMWIAYPLVGFGMYILLREMRQTQFVAAMGAALFCFTPIVLSHTRGLQPEMWLTLFTVGCAFWSVRAMRGEGEHFAWFAGALFAVLACAVRVTALPLLIVVIALALLSRRRLKHDTATLAAVAIGVATSGLLPMLIDNIRMFDHPLGAASFRHVHAAQISPRQVRTHAVRAITTLTEPPVAWPALQDRWQFVAATFAILMDATEPLPMEDQPWPGHFQPTVRRLSENYSLIGLPILIAMIAAAVGAIVTVIRRRSLRESHVVALLALTFFICVVFLVRWSGMMGRFWIAPAALGMVVLVAMIAQIAQRRRWVGVVACAFAAAVIIPAGVARVSDFRDALTHPAPAVALDEPFAEALAHIPDGTTVLLIAGQATRDYPLFRPRDGFTIRVVPWGQSAFDEKRMADLLATHHVTHIILENPLEVSFHWAPTINSLPIYKYLRRFREIPLPYSVPMRLFEVR